MADCSIVEVESLDPNLGTSTRRAVPHNSVRTSEIVVLVMTYYCSLEFVSEKHPAELIDYDITACYNYNKYSRLIRPLKCLNWYLDQSKPLL